MARGLGMDKVREQYEKWAVEESMILDMDVISGQVADWYKCDITDAAWGAWKASRAALVVELPEGNYHSVTEYENELVIRLEKAGIKYE